MSSKEEEIEKLLKSRDDIDISHVLKDKNRLGVGGNGEVYSWGKYVLKITIDLKDARNETKYLIRATGQKAHFKRIKSYFKFNAVIVSTEKYWMTFWKVIFVGKKTFLKDELLEMFGTIMIELERLHFLGVCHGDIHAGNIMFTHQNDYSRVSFIDFGSAEDSDEDMAMDDMAMDDIDRVIQLCCDAMDHFDYAVNGVSEFLRDLYRKTHEARDSHRVLRSGKVVKKLRLN